MENLDIYLISGLISLLVAIASKLIENQFSLRSRRKSLIQSLRTELETLLTIYEPLRIGEVFNWGEINIASITRNYTTVYANNADKLGLLSPATSQAVVDAYTRISSLLDTWVCYSKIYDNVIQYQRANYQSETFNPELHKLYVNDVMTNHDITYYMQETTIQAVRTAIECLDNE